MYFHTPGVSLLFWGSGWNQHGINKGVIITHAWAVTTDTKCLWFATRNLDVRLQNIRCNSYQFFNFWMDQSEESMILIIIIHILRSLSTQSILPLSPLSLSKFGTIRKRLDLLWETVAIASSCSIPRSLSNSMYSTCTCKVSDHFQSRLTSNQTRHGNSYAQEASLN